MLLLGAGAGMMAWLAWGRAAAEKRVAELVAQGDLAAAQKAVESWVVEAPSNASAHFWHGRVLFESGKPEQALAAFERARSLGYPENPMRRLVGLIFFQGGRNAQAQPLLEADLKDNPRPDLQRDRALATIYIDAYRLGPAWYALERWAEADPNDPQPFVLRAELGQRIGSGADMRAEDYREVLRRQPDHAEGRLGLADALRTQGQYSQALEEYRAYLERYGRDPRALAGAGAAALASGEESEAAEFFNEAVTLDSDHVEALDGLAAIAMRRRRFDEALPLLDRALQNDPLRTEIHYHRALALDRLGRIDEAREARVTADGLRRDAVELDTIQKRLMKTPDDANLQSRLARWLLDHGREDEGLQWAERALQAHGGHAETARMLADYFERQGNHPRANYYRTLAGR